MKILVLTQFSEIDQHLLQFTQKIAEKVSIHVDLLHVINSYPQIPLKENGTIIDHCVDYDLSQLYQLQKDKNAASAQLKSKYAFINTAQVEIGNLETIVQHKINTESYDFIFMGAHQTGVLEDLTHESIISRIMEMVDIPVLSLKCNQSHHLGIEHIGIVDEFANSTNIPKLSLIINALEATTSLIYISKEDLTQESTIKKEEQIKGFALRNNLKDIKIHILSGDEKNEEEVITACVANFNLQLVVINQLPSESLKVDIANHILSPLLIF